MRLAVIFGALLMFVQVGATSAQPGVPVTSALAAATQASSGSSAQIDPRWGLLAEMVERDYSAPVDFSRSPSTVRWEVPNKTIVWTDWNGLGRNEKRFTLNQETGEITTTWGGKSSGVVKANSVGELYWDRGKSGPFLTKTSDGTYRDRWGANKRGHYQPLSSGSKESAKLLRLIAEGKVRAANMAVAVAGGPASPQPVASQTFVTIANQQMHSPPASSVAPAIAAAAVSSGQRYALIIGNSQYGASLGRLANPVNDAQSVAAALRAVGFDVDLVTDADQRAMKRAISRLGERLSAAGRGATGLFYYAGHGIQSRGTNYLIPVTAPIEREADLDLEAVAADTVLAQMEEAGAATSIIILDACRNMPLARGLRNASRGLARMEAPNGSFIAYSTAPGSVAADGDGRNSPFAAALVKQIGHKGLPIEVMFRGIRKDVLQATGGQQTPWDSSSLIDPFYFAP